MCSGTGVSCSVKLGAGLTRCWWCLFGRAVGLCLQLAGAEAGSIWGRGLLAGQLSEQAPD